MEKQKRRGRHEILESSAQDTSASVNNFFESVMSNIREKKAYRCLSTKETKENSSKAYFLRCPIHFLCITSSLARMWTLLHSCCSHLGITFDAAIQFYCRKKKKSKCPIHITSRHFCFLWFIHEVSVHRWASCVTLRQVTAALDGDEPTQDIKTTMAWTRKIMEINVTVPQSSKGFPWWSSVDNRDPIL